MSHAHPSSVEELSPLHVAELLNGHQILLIDVRDPDEYAAQRIAGALLCPLSTSDALALPPDGPRRVVFQCGTGKRSAQAARADLRPVPRAWRIWPAASARGKRPDCLSFSSTLRPERSRVRSTPAASAVTTDAPPVERI